MRTSAGAGLLLRLDEVEDEPEEEDGNEVEGRRPFGTGGGGIRAASLWEEEAGSGLRDLGGAQGGGGICTGRVGAA